MRENEKPDAFSANLADDKIWADLAASVAGLMMTVRRRRPDASLRLRATLSPDLSSFVRFAFYEMLPDQELTLGRHVDAMANAVETCLSKAPGASSSMLPRAASNRIASRWPAWSLPSGAIRPFRFWWCDSGSRHLANDLMRRALKLMRSPRCRALFPHLRPTEITNEFVLPHGGGILYAVVGQSPIGRGADLIVIDDPLHPIRLRTTLCAAPSTHGSMRPSRAAERKEQRQHHRRDAAGALRGSHRAHRRARRLG